MAIKVPTKVTIRGPVEIGKKFIGFALSQMKILENQMSFQSLRQSSREIQPEPGVVIKCWVSFSLSEAIIIVKDVLQNRPVLRNRYAPTICYFFRITNPVDTSLTRVSDRIIIWELFINNEGSHEDKIDIGGNSGKGFIPGGGKLILDVDVITGEVYNTGVPAEEFTQAYQAEQLALALQYYELIWPDGGVTPPALPDVAGDWFTGGLIANQLYEQNRCTSRYPTWGTSLYFSESYTDSGNSYWAMMDPYSVTVPSWESIWCPASGGDPDHVYTENIWPDLYDSSLLYDKMSYAPNDGKYKVVDTINCSGPIPPGIIQDSFLYLTAYGYPGGKMNTDHNLDFSPAGYYFTSISGQLFPCFFMYEKRYKAITVGLYTYNMDSVDESGGYVIPNGSSFGYCIEGINDPNYAVSTTVNFYETGGLAGILVTPLEEISGVDILAVSGPDSDMFFCSDLPVTMEYDGFRYQNPYFAVYPSLAERAFLYDPLQPRVTDGHIPAFAYKQGTVNDRYKQYTLHIPDPNAISDKFSKIVPSGNPIPQTNFVSLMAMDERKISIQVGWRDSVSSGNLICNGITQDGSPTYKMGLIGVVIYIMAPEKFIDTSSGTAEYWDIHSARDTNQDVINAYRVLELEEYINSRLVELQEELDPTNNALHAMNYYGYTVLDGFTYSLSPLKQLP